MLLAKKRSQSVWTYLQLEDSIASKCPAAASGKQRLGTRLVLESMIIQLEDRRDVRAPNC